MACTMGLGNTFLIGQVRVVYTLFILLFLGNITQALVGVAICHDFKKTSLPCR